MDQLRAICARSVAFLRREAIEAGYGDRQLARARREGVIHRLRRGAYMFTEQWEALDEAGRHLATTAAVLRTGESELILSHTTAAVAHDAPVWDLPLDEVQVTRTDGRSGRRECGVRQHAGALEPEDIVFVNGVPVTSPARTAFDISTTTDVEHALCIVNDLLHRGLVTPAELARISKRMARVPGSLSTDLTFRLADGRCESVGESRTLYMLWKFGIPAPQTQYEIKDERGRVVARVDFAWPELGLFIEFDGRVKYEKLLRDGETATDVVLREKRREELICRLTGWRCLRLVWADLYRPQQTCELIRSTMSAPAA